jgi:hypothetical protein
MSEIQQQTNAKLCHYSFCCDHKAFGTFTVASKFVDGEDGKLYVAYGVSYCSPKDTFVKRIGNQLAIERMNNPDELYTGMLPVVHKKHNSVMLSVISDIVAYNIMPDWARPVVLIALSRLSDNELIR